MYSTCYAAEVELSGFASFAAGKTISGEQFLADYPKSGIYDSDWSFSPDTSIGIQFITEVNTQSSFVIQAVSHGAKEFQIDLDWAYLNYTINSEITFQAGRKRLPLYYYSDHFDVAYVYHWIRPPTDSYTWQITNYNGLSLIYEPNMGEWDVLFNLYTGRENSDNNDLLSTLSSNEVDETWKNMLGFVAEFSRKWLDLRFTIMQGQLDRSIDDVIVEENAKQQFAGVSINLIFEELTVLSEFNQYERATSDISLDTRMVSIAYQINDFTPHITHSKLEQEPNIAGGDEEHETNSIGIRWDFDTDIALKIQYDKVTDKGNVIPIMGDAELISLSLDMVF